MKVRFLRDYRGNQPGKEVEMPDGVSIELIRRGFCVEVKNTVTARNKAIRTPARTK